MINYRLATEQDYESINNFHNRTYKKNRTIQEFLWEFHKGPFGKSIYVIAVDGDKIVGTNCVIPIVFTNFNNEEVLTGKSEDTLVDPEYRGQNIFNHIYEFLFKQCSEQGIKIIWGYTSAKKPFEKIGFKIPYDHMQSLAVNHILSSYRYFVSLNPKNRWKEKLQILALCTLSKLKVWASGFSSSQLNYKLVEEKTVINGVDELVKDSCKNHSDYFFVQQSNNFQQWRIYDNPNFYQTHTYAAYLPDGKLAALIVLNSHKNGLAFIVQCSFHSTLNTDERKAFLKSMTISMFKKGISLIRNWHFDTNAVNKQEISSFKSAGYMIVHKGIGFVWKELHPNEVKPENVVLTRITTQGVI